jgi:dihydrofolate reductase
MSRVFSAHAVSVDGRTTHDHSGGWGGDGPHPTARLFGLSHRPVPGIGEQQTLITTGIEDAIDAARVAAGDNDVALTGGGVLASALEAGLVDEVIR